MNLRKKSDGELLSELKQLAAREKEIHLQVLHYLREVERRDLHLARGYSSLHAFAIKFLGFTESEAVTRIQAMRLLKRIPEIEQCIAVGEINVTTAARAQNAFRREEERTKEKISTEMQAKIIDRLKGKSVREAEKEIASLFPSLPKPEKARPIAKDQVRIEFTVSDNLFEKLETLKQLLAHRNFSGRYDVLIEYLADRELEKLLPKHNAPAPTTREVTKKSRYINAAIKRKIWSQFHQGCAYTDLETGRRCGEKHGLEIDHIHEFANGGSNHAKNLQLLCPAHNRYKSRALTQPYRKN